VCLNCKHAIVDEIRPRPDTPDYFGNLPLYYTLRQDDVPMVEKQWTGKSKYFSLRNYKMETIFHVAAKNNAIKSLEKMIGACVFLPHMLKKDYEGNTAIHIAAKSGSLEMLEFLLSSVTPGFLEM
jgi:ankyrin repeat protein